MTHAETIEAFYQAFAQRNYERMAACYHPSVHFSDPVFPSLVGDEVRAMWHMLCEQGTDLRVTFTGITTEGSRGSAHWEADTHSHRPAGASTTASTPHSSSKPGRSSTIETRSTYGDGPEWRWVRAAS